MKTRKRPPTHPGVILGRIIEESEGLTQRSEPSDNPQQRTLGPMSPSR